MTDDSRPEALEPPADVDQPQPAEPAAPNTPATGDTADQLRRERDEYYDLLLRKTAELDNFRKRTERERADRSQAAAADLIQELLPLVDDLERALAAEASDDAARAYRAGVELIHRQLLDLLAKRGVELIDTAGQDFDPHVHQAVAHEVSADHREGQIIDELRRGYTMHGRLLRAAMVRVAKG
jgi:molecular chaperone GrpE